MVSSVCEAIFSLCWLFLVNQTLIHSSHEEELQPTFRLKKHIDCHLRTQQYVLDKTFNHIHIGILNGGIKGEILARTRVRVAMRMTLFLEKFSPVFIDFFFYLGRIDVQVVLARRLHIYTSEMLESYRSWLSQYRHILC